MGNSEFATTRGTKHSTNQGQYRATEFLQVNWSKAKHSNSVENVLQCVMHMCLIYVQQSTVLINSELL